MFGGNYYGRKFFGSEYWGAGSGAVVVTTVTGRKVRRGRSHGRMRQPWPLPSNRMPDRPPIYAKGPVLDLQPTTLHIEPDKTGHEIKRLRKLIEGAKSEKDLAEARQILDEIRNEIAEAGETAAAMADAMDGHASKLRADRSARDVADLAESHAYALAERTAYLATMTAYNDMRAELQQIEDEIEDEETITVLMHAMEYYR